MSVPRSVISGSPGLNSSFSSSARCAHCIHAEAVETFFSDCAPFAPVRRALRVGRVLVLDDRAHPLSVAHDAAVIERAMDGVEKSAQGYVIVKGSGIPAITVLGYNRSVSWNELLERVQRITAGNKPVIK